MKQILILTLVIIGLLLVPVSATIEITPVNVTSSSIMWSWSPVTIQNLSIDGIFVCNFNPAATDFVLSGLGPNEPHTITIITAGDSGSNTTSTAGDKGSDQAADFTEWLNTWGYMILIIALCVVGMFPKLGFVLLVACGVDLYALYLFITENVITDGDPLIQIPFLIYVCFFIIPLWLCFGVKKGVFR